MSSDITPETVLSIIGERILREAPYVPEPEIYKLLLDTAWYLFVDDFAPPPDPVDDLSRARHTDAINRIKRISTPEMLNEWINTVAISLAIYLNNIPDSDQGSFKTSISVSHQMVDHITAPFRANRNPEMFAGLKRTLRENAEDKKADPLQRVQNTQLAKLLTVSIPFGIPHSSWKEHGFLFAKSGHGKSQTLRTIVASLLGEDCALFLLDGNGALIKDLERIESIQDRLIILDPDDTPALNFFRMSVQPEQQLELYFYLFNALDQSLTPRMATMVSYLVDLMKVIPGSNLDTLRQVCEAKQFPFLEELTRLPQSAQDFFAHHFNIKDQFVSTTKASLAQRLHRLSSYPKFLAMMNAPTNGFDALQAMQEKKIVIVDASRRKLGDDGSAIFGRYILAQCLAAAWQRSDRDHLALIVVDEAKAYLDQHSKKFLSDTRNFNVGLLLATQFADQLDEGVRKEVINNTSVKIAGPMAYSVVAQLNRDMRCDADFILGMKKKDFDYAQWACYVDNLTPQAIRLTVPFGAIEKLPMVPLRARRAPRDHTATDTRTAADTSAPAPRPPPAAPLKQHHEEPSDTKSPDDTDQNRWN